jgi:hypothetical protein
VNPNPSNNTASDTDVMWKEWLKHPPHRKAKGTNLDPPVATDMPDSSAALALTGSDIRWLVFIGLFLTAAGFEVRRTVRPRPHRRR